MNDIKKITAFILALILFAANSAFLNTAAAAENSPLTIRLSAPESVETGASFEVAVSVTNNMTRGASITVSVDSTAFTLTAFNDADMIVPALETATHAFGFDSSGTGAGFYEIKITVVHDFAVYTESVRVEVIIPPEKPPEEITGNVRIESIVMPGAVKAGDVFEAAVTVKNTNRLPADITVRADTANSLLTPVLFSSVTETIRPNSTKVFIFTYKANPSEEFASAVSQIKFTVSSDTSASLASETKNITINTPPESKKPLLEIIPATTLPIKAGAGKTARMSFTVRNVGADSENVTITVTGTPAGIIPLSPTTINAGKIPGGGFYRFDFDFEVKENAAVDYCEIDISAAGGEAQASYRAGVIIEKSGEGANAPDIRIVSVLLPEIVNRGESFELKGVMENAGADADNVEVTVVLPAGMDNTSPNKIQLGPMKQNEKREFTIAVFVKKEAADNYNSFEIIINDGHSEKKQYAGLNISSDEDKIKDFTISVNIPASVVPGADFKVTVTIKNNGADAKNLVLKVSPQDAGVEQRTNNTLSIHELKSGESAAREVTFFASEAAGGKYCSFKIELTGADITAAEQYAGMMVEGAGRPSIKIETIKIPKSVNIGDTFNVEVTIANNGAAAAEDITLAIAGQTGMLNQTAGIVKLGPVLSGQKETATFTFTAAQNAAFGYNPFTLDVSYASNSGAAPEVINQYFGVIVNASALRIGYIKIPGSVGLNYDFTVEVAVTNTGADAENATLSLAPQGGLINKSADTVKIDRIKSGETIVRSFTFMATESAPNGYVAITVTLTHGDETIRQYSGTNVNNPPKTDEENQEEKDKHDIPVVIISKFNYASVEEEEEEKEEEKAPSDNYEENFDQGGGVIEFFENTVMIDSPSIMAPMRPMPGGDPGSGGGSTGGGGTPSSSKPRDANAVYGGKSFIFTLELLNTHRSIPVRDLKVTISQEKGIFNPKAGSNTFFVERLEPGETTEIDIELLVKPDADPDSYGITISLSYKNENGDAASASEIINIPVQQELRFSIGETPPVSDVEMGDEAYINVQFGNLGRSWIYNVVVRVQGDGFTNMEGTYYAGNIEAGKFIAKEFALTPFNAGFMNGEFVFTYEDADGNEYSDSQPFYFNVMGGEDMWEMPPDYDGFDPGLEGFTEDGENVESGGGFWLFSEMNPLKWTIIIGGVIVIAAVAVAVIVTVRRRRNIDIDDDDI